MRSGQQIWDVVPSPGKQKGDLSSMPTSPNHSSRQLEVAAQQVAFRLPESLVRRFYALELTALDRARILVGRPPRGMSLRAAVFGHAHLKEQTLHWLTGYRHSAPVRIGNMADGQFQLDIYGEVLDAAYAYAPLVEEFDRNSKAFLIGLGNVICKV